VSELKKNTWIPESHEVYISSSMSVAFDFVSVGCISTICYALSCLILIEVKVNELVATLVHVIISLALQICISPYIYIYACSCSYLISSWEMEVRLVVW
jgi:hypothetical protein